AQFTYDFQEVVLTYGNSIAAKHNTKLLWVDLHATNPAMQQYDWCKVSVSLINTTFYKATKPEYMTATESNQTIVNDSDKDLTSTPVLKYSVTNDHTFTILTALKQANSFNLNLNLGDIISIGIGDTITEEVDFQTTQAQSHTETSDSESSATFTIPPHQKRKFYALVQKVTFSTGFNASLKISGCAALWFQDKILDHYLMFQSVQEIVNNVSSIDPSQITVYKSDSTGVNFTAKGIVQVVYGYNSTIEAENV
ncbi:11586_t:CDS:1, partial [Ambispora leptoticha]